MELDIPTTEDTNKIEYKYVRIFDDGSVVWESSGAENRWIPNEVEAKSQTIIVDDGDISRVQPFPYGYWQTPPVSKGTSTPTDDPTDEKKKGLNITVIGSSVAMGCSSWMLRGWAEHLRTALAEKFGHQLVNVSRLGANVTSTIDRFASVVTPTNPDIVIIALSLGNEGFAYCPAHQRHALQQRFEGGLLHLIKMTREIGAIPVLGAVYPHGDYTPEHNWFLQDTHQRMLTWDVPVFDWLNVLSDDQGRWQSGLNFDNAHPNMEGHRLMMETIDLSIFDVSPEQLKEKKNLYEKPEIKVFNLENNLAISFNRLTKRLEIINYSLEECTIDPSHLELKVDKDVENPLELSSSLVSGMYLANSSRAKTFSFNVAENNELKTQINLPADSKVEYFPLSHYFNPTISDILFYDGNIAILKPHDINAVYILNQTDHDYNVQPMWKEVRKALTAIDAGVYVDTLNPDTPFRTLMVSEDGLDSRLKIPGQTALVFSYQCPLSEISRVAILSLGDRCATRMLLHKMEYDGPAYPFDLTRTTNLSDVADIIENGFEQMWEPDLLHYNYAHNRIYHQKWTGLSFAHEVEDDDDPIENMSVVHQRMKRRYSSRSQRFWYTIANCDEVLFVRTGGASRSQVEDLMAKLEYKCQGKPFRLLILSEQDSNEFAGIPQVIHKDIYFNPDWMYDNLEHWMYCTHVMHGILTELGISSKNLYWCPPKIK